MIRRALWACLVMVSAYLGGAAMGGLIPGTVQLVAPQPGDDVEIGLIFGPIHVDFLLPNDAVTREALGFAGAAGLPLGDARVRHVLVGWGARDFYTTAGTYADVTLGATWRAISGDSSVLRLDTVGALPTAFDYPRLHLSAAQYRRLLASIAQTASGEGPIAGAGLTGSDLFVGAEGRFDILRTCNTWVSRVLRDAGVAMGAWTPTPYAVRLSLWRLGLG